MTGHSAHTALAEAIIGIVSGPPSGSGKNKLVSSDEHAALRRHLSTSHLTGEVAVAGVVAYELTGFNALTLNAVTLDVWVRVSDVGDTGSLLPGRFLVDSWSFGGL